MCAPYSLGVRVRARVNGQATGHGGSSLALYRNGGLVQDGVHANPRSGAHVPGADVAYTVGRLGVSRGEGGVRGDHFAGAIRAVRIYRRALPPGAVRRLVPCAPDCLHPPSPAFDLARCVHPFPTKSPSMAIEGPMFCASVYLKSLLS